MASKLATVYATEREALGKLAREFKNNPLLVPKPVPGEIFALDCFSGCGGFGLGLLRAAREAGFRVHSKLLNHWDVALDNARENLGDVTVFNGGIQEWDPLDVVPSGYLDIMLASPECIWHSTARGNRPINDQKRSTCGEILRFMEDLYIETVVIENVVELKNWSRLDEHQRPLKKYRGEYFEAFIRAIKRLDYDVAFQDIIAADHGDPTTRKRLFIVCQKRRRASLPPPSHSKDGKIPGTQCWIPARKIIDFSIKGLSIFSRSSPHVTKTLRRIGIGFEDQREKTPLAGAYVESIERFKRATDLYYAQIANLPTAKKLKRKLTNHEQAHVKRVKAAAQAQHRLLVQEIFKNPVAVLTWNDLLLHESVQPTLAGESRLLMGTLNAVDPVVTKLFGTGTVTDVDQPLDTIKAGGTTFGLAEPLPKNIAEPKTADTFLVTVNHADNESATGRHASLDDPLQTITTRGSHGVVQPFCLRANCSDTSAWNDATTSVDDPLRTVTTKANLGLIVPDATILPQHTYDLETTISPDKTLPTITTICRHGLAQPEIAEVAPFIDRTFGPTGPNRDQDIHPRSLEQPLPTQTATMTFALVEPTLGAIEPDPFIAGNYGPSGPDLDRDRKPHSVESPLPTQTATSTFALVQSSTAVIDPFIASYYGPSGPNRDRDRKPRSIDEPLGTQTTENTFALVTPEATVPLPEHFVTPNFGERPRQKPSTHSLDEPLPTATSHGAGMLVGPDADVAPSMRAQPVVVNLKGKSTATSIDVPLPTQTAHAPHLYVAEPDIAATAESPVRLVPDPVLVSRHIGFEDKHSPNPSLDEPVVTATCRGAGYIAQPEIVPDPVLVSQQYGYNENPRIDEPLGTATTRGAGYIAQAGYSELILRAIASVTPGKPYIIVDNVILELDVTYRMLNADELSRAMSFETENDEYVFRDDATQSERVKMIGNAVAAETARRITAHALAYRFKSGEVCRIPQAEAA